VLAMLELKSALEDDLCAILGLERMPGHEQLLTQLSQQSLLDTEALRTLKRLLLRLSSIETMVLSQRHQPQGAAAPVPLSTVRDTEVLQVARAIKKILRTCHGRAEMARNVEKLVQHQGEA